ncbi:cytochrome b [Vibrio pacinii]|uniref:cytochrome b n=1 Tax=Vibrio pacinii TaxID=170674 RepID=UPI0009FEC7E9|nr:cytochrome b/b6 domain-containing protein [Vibrio pacinii]
MLQVNNKALFNPSSLDKAPELTEQHRSLTKWLHWSMAVIILYATFAGYGMLLVMDRPVLFHVLSNLNISLATLATILFFVRWVWKFFRVEPELPNTISDTQKSFAKLAHGVMYFAMFVVFISGYLMLKHSYQFFWVIEIPNLIDNVAVNEFFFVVHRASCLTLAILVVVHILAALKHHYIIKNNVLRSMMIRFNK